MYRFGLGIILLSSSSLLLSAATEPIGLAVSTGSILVNSASTDGNATVFEGSMLGSGSKASTQVRLNNGARVRLFLSSEGKLFSDHVDLISGSAEIAGYSAVANGLKVSADANSSAEISKQGKAIQVAALSGDVHVFNAQGISVANLLPGRIMSFFPQPQDAGASAPSSLTGCPVKTGNIFTLKDETSNVTVQLQGGNIKANRRVQVTGTMVPNATPPAGATQVINVTAVKEVGGACQGAAGAGAGGGGGASAGAGGGHAGVYIGAAAAVVAGVVAGVVATNGGSSNSSSTGAATKTYYTDSAGNIYTVTTTVSGGNTTQVITQTTPQGVTTTIGSLPSITSDPSLSNCMSPCH